MPTILLGMCGAQTFQLMRTLAAPTSLMEKSYDELTKLLSEYDNPKPTIILQPFSFNSESVATFAAALQQLAED